MDIDQCSKFVVGRIVSISELAKYWGRILHHASATGQRIVIAKRGQPTHMLVPLNDRSQPLPADNAINGSEQEECHGSCR